MPDLSGTIVAEATPAARGSLRVLRLSGTRSFDILKAAFVPLEGIPPWEAPRSLVLGSALGASGKAVDRGMAVCFPGPRSLTGEDVVELHLHGAPGVVRAVLETLVGAGGRPALPGEFSFRAWVNGKCSLLDAEAVQALVGSETEGQASRLAAAGLGRAFQGEVESLREALMDLKTRLEARVDFPEDAGAGDAAGEDALLDEAEGRLSGLISSARSVRSLRSGFRVALVGPPNVGKSALFNALLKRERALVTPHPGTTRDVLEETLEVAGLPVTICDTAGIRETEEPVERLGVARSLEAASGSDGAVMVYGLDKGWDAEAEGARARLGSQPILVAANKADLHVHAAARPSDVRVSALTGEGLGALVDALGRWVAERTPRPGPHPYALRHVESLREARDACRRAANARREGLSEEYVVQGVGDAVDALDDLLTGGPGDPEELYERIFSSFCIGK